MKCHLGLVLILAGILWLPANLVAQETEPGVTIHVVQRGENLFRIALAYGLTVDELAQLNGIADPSNIQVGQRILVPAVPVPSVPTTHTIQAGETLQSIADLYQKSVEELASLNNITDPNTIYVGQVLNLVAIDIPATPTPVIVASDSKVTTSSSTDSLVHIVQQGETLFRIATNYGLSVNEVASANNISDPTLIYAGQQLIIPGIESPILALDLPAPITGLDISPIVWVNGQAGRVRLWTSAPSGVTGAFLGQALNSASQENGGFHTMLVGIPMATAANIYPFEVTVNDSSGQVTEFTFNVQVIAKNYGSQNITLPDDKLDLVNVNIENNELDILERLTTPFTPERYFSGPMGLPAAAAMNGAFGAIRSYNGGPFDRYHNGADFAGVPGTPVLAAASGRVIMADILNIRGNATIIDHGWGVYTTYSHQAEQYVHVGDLVTSGQVIGTIGASGRTTGAHLHWELWVNGVPVDPMQWVEQSFP